MNNTDNNPRCAFCRRLFTVDVMLTDEPLCCSDCECDRAHTDLDMTTESDMDYLSDNEVEREIGMDESMDGDAESALSSAGLGTDEDYGYYGGGDDDF